MANPIATGDACLPLKSNGLDLGTIRGGILPASSNALALELDCSIQHPLGLSHDGHIVAHHLHAPASWSAALHLSANQANNESPPECRGASNKRSLPFSKGKSLTTSDDDESSWKEGMDEPHGGKGKRTCPWQRIKWTNEMVKFLINVVNLVGEDGTVESSDASKRSPGLCQKKGKWRSVSSAMNEGGWHVSPQQCEDKFNDLNKRYKRLNDILGLDVALRVVDNPHLLDSMCNLSSKRRDDVKKLLTSKHSFYKEMHLYHSGFKPVVPSGFPFQASLQSAISGEPYEAFTQVVVTRPLQTEYLGKGMNLSARGDGEDGDHEYACADSSGDIGRDGDRAPSAVRLDSGRGVDGTPSVLCQTHRILRDGHASPLVSDCKEATEGINAACSVPVDASPSTETLNMVRCRMMQLEEMKVNLQARALEIEQQRYKWQMLNSKRDAELERMREDNKKLKYENDQLSYQLKQKELEVECKRSVVSMSLIDHVLRNCK